MTIKKTRFDPKSIFTHLDARPPASSSIQPDPQDAQRPPAAPQVEPEDDDFMSDRFLLNASGPTLTSAKRASKQKQGSGYRGGGRSGKSRRSRKEREEEARRDGLERDLLAEAEVVAGAGEGALPPLDSGGRRMWEQVEGGLDAFGGGEGGTVPEAGKGKSAAMRMMLAMGYKRGMALGRQDEAGKESGEEEEEDGDDEGGEGEKGGTAARDGSEEDALGTGSESGEDEEDDKHRARKEHDDQRQEDEYLSGGISTATFGTSVPKTKQRSPPSLPGEPLQGGKRARLPDAGSSCNDRLTEPLRVDERWLSGSRLGIGMVPRATLQTARTPVSVSTAIHAAAASASAMDGTGSAERSAEQQLQDFRSRASESHRQRHVDGLLARSRKTLRDLDRANGVEYNPLWLDANLWKVLTGRTDGGMGRGELDEQIERDPATREAVELLEFAFGSELDLVELERSGKDVAAEARRQAGQRREEAQAFCMLEAKTMLDLILSRLREEHTYCLYCGMQYGDRQEMEQLCPGTEEDEHD